MEQNEIGMIGERCAEAWDRLDDISDSLNEILSDLSDMTADIRSEIFEIRLQIGGCLKMMEHCTGKGGGADKEACQGTAFRCFK